MRVNAGCAALLAAGDGVNKLPDWMRRCYMRITMHLRSSGLSYPKKKKLDSPYTRQRELRTAAQYGCLCKKKLAHRKKEEVGQ